MKLYTEEQVRNAYIDGYYDCRVGEDSHHDSYQCPNPIELPSDDEIEKALPDGFPHSDGYDAGKICGFEEGAKWIKKQILNQNK